MHSLPFARRTSTVSFCYYLLGGNIVALTGLLARLCHAFLVSSFFNLRQIMSGSTGPIFTIFSPNVRYLHEFSRSGPLFLILLGTLPWQPILEKICEKKLFNTLAFRKGFKYRNSAFEVIKGTIFATFCAILVKIGSLIPEIMQGVSVPFGTRRQKSTYHLSLIHI